MNITKDQIKDRAGEAAFGKPLANNVLRAIVVETMIDAALPGGWSWCSTDYASCDFRHSDGTRLEVKQSAALQSWSAPGHASRSSFDIAPRTGEWHEGTRWVPGVGRNADMYVLAHHPVIDATADHREPMQWDFYVVPVSSLPATRSISLTRVRAICPSVAFADLAAEVERVRESRLSEGAADAVGRLAL